MWRLHRWLQTETNARLPFFNVTLFSDVVKAVMNKKGDKQEPKTSLHL